MVTINWNKRLLNESKALHRSLEEDGALLIRDFPVKGNQELLELSCSLGNLIAPPAAFQQNSIEDIYVYRVEENKSGSPGVISHTALAFPFHTDGFRSLVIPDYVLLLAVDQSEKGGESVLVHIDDLLPRLTDDVVSELSTKIYSFPSGASRPVFTRLAGRVEVAFNPFDLLGLKATERNAGNLGVLDQEMGLHPAADAFYKALNEAQEAIRFTMKPGDCSIINNKRVLHSRSAFEGKRLLKRVWVSKN